MIAAALALVVLATAAHTAVLPAFRKSTFNAPRLFQKALAQHSGRALLQQNQASTGVNSSGATIMLEAEGPPAAGEEGSTTCPNRETAVRHVPLRSRA